MATQQSPMNRRYIILFVNIRKPPSFRPRPNAHTSELIPWIEGNRLAFRTIRRTEKGI
jgi:hypothetical protein